MGEISGSQMKIGRGPLHKKGEKKKKKRGRELEKNTGVVENPNTRVR